MGKRIKLLVAGIFLMAGVLAGNMGVLGEEPPSIEQVYVNLPEVTVYGSGWPAEELQAFLGQEQLSYIERTTFAQTGEPIYYYILLDVSNSMPNAYFQAVKQSIVNFESLLNEQDRMALYTFGETVELRLAEEHTPEDTAAVMESVTNTDNRTLMFEAIRAASDRAGQLGPEVCKRKVILVISDGEDFNIGNTGVNEAQDCLRKSGIPAYAFALKDTARENINSFGEFARTSGGTLTVFDVEQAGVLLDSFPGMMAGSDVLEWQSGNNLETNRLETFSVRTAANQGASREVMVSRHIKDEEAPELTLVEQLEDAQIAVEFSEQVEGAENSSNYVITRRDLDKKKKDKDKDKDKDKEDEDEEEETEAGETEEETREEETEKEDEDEEEDGESEIITVLSVSADKEIANRMVLSFADDLKPGRYTVSCVGITDVSMEKNPVENAIRFEVDQLPLMTRIGNWIKNWYWIGLILAVVALIVVIVQGVRKVKQGRGVVYVDGKPVMASDVEIHKHIAIQEQEGKAFYLRISVKGNRPEEMTLHMNESFIVGRAQMCNLYFDDKRMSRQHFALEWDGQNMYITDLETTNGTFINKVQIHGRRRLEQNDVISAGSVEFTIRW